MPLPPEEEKRKLVKGAALGWLAFGSARPRRIAPQTLRCLIATEVVIFESDGTLALTERGLEYAKTMRSPGGWPVRQPFLLAISRDAP